MHRVLSLPELPSSRTLPPSVNAPSGAKTKRPFGIGSPFKSRSAEFDAEPSLRIRSDRKPQRQRVGAPRDSVVPSEPLSEQQRQQDEQWLQEEQRVQELLRIKPKEAARSPGRKLLASIASPAHELDTFRSPLVGFELRLAAALKDATEPSPTEERAGACFAVLRGLSEHVAVEFRPLIDRLTLELQHAVYDRSAPDESSHFVQLGHARAHAANLTVDLAAEREDSRRLRAEAASLRAELREVEHLEQLARHEPAAADIKRAFTKYDWNESGLLDAKELSAALFDLAPPCRDVIMPESEVRRVLNEYDHSGDGLLSLGEFGQLVRQLAVWDYEKEEEERVREQQESRLDSRPSSVDDGDGQAGVAEPRVVLVDGLGQGLGESKASGEGAKAGGAKARKAGKRAGKEPKQKGGAEGGQPPEEVDEAAECSVPYAEVFEIRVAHSQLVEELQQAMREMVPLDEVEETKHYLSATRQRLAEALENAREAETEAREAQERLAEQEVQLSEATQSVSEMRRAWTPRPNWAALAEAADDAGPSARAAVAGLRVTSMPSRASLTGLCGTLSRLWARQAELEPRLPNEGPFHVGLENGPEVPVHLRHCGRLRNRRLPKAEVEQAVRRVWRATEQHGRTAAEAAGAGGEASGEASGEAGGEVGGEVGGAVSVVPSLSQAFAEVAAEAFGTDRYAAAEWCYNVEDGCRRYVFDADLDLFLAALQGHAPESAWRQQQELLRRLLHSLRAADPASREEAGGGWCGPDAVMAAVASLWPHLALSKERQLRQLLTDAAEPGHSGHGPALQYEELLAEHEDSGGDQSPFAELLRKAHAAEPRDFMRALHALLRARDATARDSAAVTAATVRGVILLVDPGRPADNVRAMLSLGFGGTHGKAGGGSPMPRRHSTGVAPAEEPPAMRRHTTMSGGSPAPRRTGAPGEPLPDTATVRIDHFLANVRPSFPRWLGGKPQELDALLKQVEGAV